MIIVEQRYTVAMLLLMAIFIRSNTKHEDLTLTFCLLSNTRTYTPIYIHSPEEENNSTDNGT